MACSKYTLTNTGSTIVNFSYRRCDDSFWDYQVELAQNETKNIWVIDGTYTVASSFRGSIVLANAGSFPPTSVTPTNTPTQTPTPTNTTTPTNTASNTPTPSVTATGTGTPTPTPTNTGTGTQTPTPTNTATQTPTPTNTGTQTPTPTNTGTGSTPTPTPTNTGTPTQTVTPTNTGTPTPTVTSTNTPSPTPTFGYYTYSLGTGATANDACVDFSGSPNTIYGTVAGGPGPNAGEFLYTTPGNPPTNPVANGYYSNGTAVFIVSGGLGQITSVDPNGCL